MENEFNPENIFDIELYKSLKGKEAVSERLVGRQPIIDIDGQPYFVKLHFGILEPANNFLINPIHIGDIEMDHVTKKLFFYFNTETKEREFIDEGLTELPKNVVQVETPNKYYLDPVAMARLNGRAPEDYHYYGIPLRMYRKATITPLHKTDLLAEVNENRQHAGMEPLPAGKKPQTNKQKKRRMGL